MWCSGSCALLMGEVRRYDTAVSREEWCGLPFWRRAFFCDDGESGLTEHLIGKLGYVGIALILILGGLGLPIPEEAPILVAAVLSRNGTLTWPLALASCLSGVMLGDMVVYFLGFFYGEKVLSLPLTRKLLTRQREVQFKGYFQRHGFKILVFARFAPGFRTAAYLTAGILKLPPVKLLLTDLVAASLSTVFFFGLGYAFAHQMQRGIREVQQWVLVGVAVGVVVWLLIRYYRAKRRSGQPVGPPVLDDDADPLSIDRPKTTHAQPGSSGADENVEQTAPEVEQAGQAIEETRPTESGTRQPVKPSARLNHTGGRAGEGGGRRAEDGGRTVEEEVGVRES
jgi:membrane protein DedA with SNARE-associated domain